MPERVGSEASADRARSVASGARRRPGCRHDVRRRACRASPRTDGRPRGCRCRVRTTRTSNRPAGVGQDRRTSLASLVRVPRRCPTGTPCRRRVRGATRAWVGRTSPTKGWRRCRRCTESLVPRVCRCPRGAAQTRRNEPPPLAAAPMHPRLSPPAPDAVRSRPRRDSRHAIRRWLREATHQPWGADPRPSFGHVRPGARNTQGMPARGGCVEGCEVHPFRAGRVVDAGRLPSRTGGRSFGRVGRSSRSATCGPPPDVLACRARDPNPKETSPCPCPDDLVRSSWR